MKFRNPWIDPRILQLHPEAVRAYLLAREWQYLGPAEVPDLLMFDTPQPRGDKPNVLLPTSLDHPHQVQRMIDLVADVALHEDRYAGDVLTDMLQTASTTAAPANGPAASAQTQPATK